MFEPQARGSLVAALAMLALPWPSHASGAREEWNFTALLDGKPIGTHRFTLDDADSGQTLDSDADFAVRMLGIAVYRYRHHASERWRDGCLQTLTATTDDDGKRSRVKGERQGDDFRVAEASGSTETLPATAGCAMSFAYWNPALRQQSRLVNPQTGRVEAVTIAPLADRSIDVRGVPVAAQGIRIRGAGAAIDVWYSAQNAWIGLDTTVANDAKLSYRLR